MAADPEWLALVRAAHKAVMAAESAVMEAFPLGSRWVCHGARVVVTGPGDRAGELYVTIDSLPHWQKQVSATALKPLAAPKEKPPND